MQVVDMKVRNMPQINLRIKPEVKEWIIKESEKRERSQNWLISKLLEDEMLRSISQAK